jgi:16S rRNA G1207 methylase RsmC
LNGNAACELLESEKSKYTALVMELSDGSMDNRQIIEYIRRCLHLTIPIIVFGENKSLFESGIECGGKAALK